MNFTAIDVETANANLSSICQIGVVTFRNGSVADKWERLVNPEDYFHPINVSIHGITSEKTANAATLPKLFDEMRKMLAGQVVVSHTPFDRISLSRATEKYGLSKVECRWLDSAMVTRRAWPQYARSGYGLFDITQSLDIPFIHHNAIEDARAAGEIVLRAIKATDVALDDWLARVKQPITRIAQEGDPDGPLSGEVVVFTGALSIPRRDAAKSAANAGCMVSEAVNKATTRLVVGDQDVSRLAGHEKSSKHRKAESLIQRGQSIRILAERDFQHLLESEGA